MSGRMQTHLQEVPTENLTEVVRLAQRLYEADQARQEEARQRTEVFQAAEELGIPAAYLERAAAEIRLRSAAQTTAPVRTHRRAPWALAVALATGVMLALGLLYGTRSAVAPPAVATVERPDSIAVTPPPAVSPTMPAHRGSADGSR